MARVSFTLRKNVAISFGGSALQSASASWSPSTNDDTALRGDSYTDVPSAIASASEFEIKAIDYGISEIRWALTTELVTSLTATPEPTQIAVVYSPFGRPETVDGGERVVTITPTTPGNITSHVNNLQGKWAYYSLFVRYGSTERMWWERVAFTEVMMPNNYNSTDSLFQRIPTFYRLQDELMGSANSMNVALSGLPTRLKDKGPLYRALDVIGWDIDYLRSISEYLMTQKDPYNANTEMLDAIAYEIGSPISSRDLGDVRLRNLLTDLSFLMKFKGSNFGVTEYLSAVTGCDVELEPTQYNYFSSSQTSPTSSDFDLQSSAVVPNYKSAYAWNCQTAEAAGPSFTHTVDRAVFSGTAEVGSYSVIGEPYYPNIEVFRSSAGSASTEVMCIATKLTNVSNASQHVFEFGIIQNTGASVLGVYLADEYTSASAVAINSTGITSSPPGFIETPRYGLSITADFGITGDGSLSSTSTKYLHIFIATDELYEGVLIKPYSFRTKNQYPYNINVYSNRVNLLRDPKFANQISTAGTNASTSAFWRVSGASVGAITVSYSTNTASLTGASAGEYYLYDLTTPDGSLYAHVPIRRGRSYYFSIDDYNDNVKEVLLTLVDLNLVIAESTSPIRTETLSSGAIRKYWRLDIPSGPPNYFQENILGATLRIKAVTTSASEAVKIGRPLFEYNSIGEYFDGDSENGGWLAGATVAAGVADYRWGDNGVNASFSYYSPDYMRTRSVVNRLIQFIAPVHELSTSTQTYDTSKLLFNRIHGYSGNDQP